MKAILEFDLPDDKSNHEVAVHAMDFALVCWDLDIYLEREIECALEHYDQDLQSIRDKLHELMAEHNVSFDMIE